MYRKLLLTGPLVLMIIFSGNATSSEWDGPWKDTVTPHLNIYKF